MAPNHLGCSTLPSLSPTHRAIDSGYCDIWRYHMRRQMQEVFPGLFLGPYSSASKSKLSELEAAGITHIICVRSEAEAHIVKPHFPDAFKYLVVTIENVPVSMYDPELREALDRGVAFISSSVRSGGRCLVYGVSGLCRSAVLVLAYIITDTRCTEQQALGEVAAQRYCVAVTEPFMKFLKQYSLEVQMLPPVVDMILEPPMKRKRI